MGGRVKIYPQHLRRVDKQGPYSKHEYYPQWFRVPSRLFVRVGCSNLKRQGDGTHTLIASGKLCAGCFYGYVSISTRFGIGWGWIGNAFRVLAASSWELGAWPPLRESWVHLTASSWESGASKDCPGTPYRDSAASAWELGASGRLLVRVRCRMVYS